MALGGPWPPGRSDRHSLALSGIVRSKQEPVLGWRGMPSPPFMCTFRYSLTIVSVAVFLLLYVVIVASLPRQEIHWTVNKRARQSENAQRLFDSVQVLPLSLIAVVSKRLVGRSKRCRKEDCCSLLRSGERWTVGNDSCALRGLSRSLVLLPLVVLIVLEIGSSISLATRLGCSLYQQIGDFCTRLCNRTRPVRLTVLSRV